MSRSRTQQPRGLDFLDGRTWNEQALQDLVASKGPEEDLHVEYKGGDWLKKPDERKGELRWYVTGFANAEGGVLIIGVKEGKSGGQVDCEKNKSRPDRLEPITTSPPHLEGWAAWVHDVLRENVYPKHSPPAQVQAFEGQGGSYVVVTIPPTNHVLVSCRGEGKTYIYPARVGSSTVPLDEWCVQAILLGTRRTPRISVTGVVHRPEWADDDDVGVTQQEMIRLHVRHDFQNKALTYLESPSWGIVTPSPCESPKNSYGRRLNEMVITQIRATGCKPLHIYPPKPLEDLVPFVPLELGFGMIMRFRKPCRIVRINYALYIVGKNTFPNWFAASVARGSDGEFVCEVTPQDYGIPVGVETDPEGVLLPE